ncbi:adrenocortical dysplasia protein homolog isoform X2 [Ranitomeya variabilis]|uniref:adrenocortical dysplasia protein homolog isoform X2 n=1 Tax=Ranitomeya variabilis TaxID=490064 RepID=UPI004056D018
MAGYHSLIGYPWIIDCIDKYDRAVVKQKPVPGQIVEFLRMPDRSVYSEACQYPEAVINISDQKYYIRAVITKEAQEKLESEDEHFSLANIKNKIIILKKFSVCFAAVEDLSRCEFYLTVQHFSVLPMETNTVDILNCNMEPGVRKKMKELWQNYMTELELNETDMNLSDVSLTQLLMIASEEKFSALKSIAEQCLELNPSVIQDVPQQGKNFWSIQKNRNQENAEQFVIPLDLLLIPPHEEAILEQLTECRSEDPCTSEPADSSERDNSYSQPKCSSSVSQKSRENDAGSDPDSSTPDIFTPHADVSIGESSDGKSGISPLMFSEHSSNPEQPSTSRPQTDSANNNASPNCKQGGSVHSSAVSLNLIPLTQDSFKDSLQRSLSTGSEVQISPIKSMSENKSSSASKRDRSFLCNESNRGKSCSPGTRRPSKRKHTSGDPESTRSDLARQDHSRIEKPDCVTTTVLSCDESDTVSDNEDGVKFTEVRHQIGKKEAASPDGDIKQNNKKSEQHVKSRNTRYDKLSSKRIKAHKPRLLFVANPTIHVSKDSTNGLASNKDLVQEAPSNAMHGSSSSFQVKEKNPVSAMEIGRTKLVHRDGTPFQYKYKSPSEDLCAQVKAIQIPAELCEWAAKMLSEDQEKVL